MAEKSELDILFPGIEVTARGETFTVQPFKTKQWRQATKIVADLIPSLAKYSVGGKVNMVGLMLDSADPFMELVSLGIGKPMAWLDETSGDEAITLATAVFELNRDEFVKKMMPLLGNLLPVAEAEANPAAADGSDSSKS